MTNQSDIPAATPEDDIIEKQERVEFLVDQMITSRLASQASVAGQFWSTYTDALAFPNAAIALASYGEEDPLPDGWLLSGNSIEVPLEGFYVYTFGVDLNPSLNLHETVNLAIQLQASASPRTTQLNYVQSYVTGTDPSDIYGSSVSMSGPGGSVNFQAYTSQVGLQGDGFAVSILRVA